MIDMIFEFSKGAFYGLIQFGLYWFIRNNKYKLVKGYFFIILILATIPLVEMLCVNEIDILGVIVQGLSIIVAICIIKAIHSTDQVYQSIYQMMSAGKMRVLLGNGISQIKKEDVSYYAEKLNEVNIFLSSFKKKPYANISYEKDSDCLEVSFIITNKKDFKKLAEQENLGQGISIKDITYGETGGSATILVNNID